VKSIIVLTPLNFQSMKPSVLERIAGGDSTAVNDCVVQYGALVWSLARRFSRTLADAEDATQEIFLNIWRGAILYDEAKGCEAAFIVTIARRRLIDRRRKWKSELMIDSCIDVADTPASSDSGASPEISLEAEAAIGALRQLRPEQRRLLELNLILGLSQSEISARLNIPLGTVKSR
jgi:RNA polymerase sigma factor (sigma-70 family)